MHEIKSCRLFIGYIKSFFIQKKGASQDVCLSIGFIYVYRTNQPKILTNNSRKTVKRLILSEAFNHHLKLHFQIFIFHSIFTDCCAGLSVTYKSGSSIIGTPGAGDYSLNGTINDFPYWKNTDNTMGIWLAGGNWLIGDIDKLGKGNGYVATKKQGSTPCPRDPSNTWRYWRSAWFDTTDVVFTCKSEFFFPINICQIRERVLEGNQII